MAWCSPRVPVCSWGRIRDLGTKACGFRLEGPRASGPPIRGGAHEFEVEVLEPLAGS